MSVIHPASRRAITGIVPYEPGKPIGEVQRELGLADVVKLASNENPLGPSPKALAAVREALPELHRYPDGGGWLLKQKLAGKLNLPPEWLVLGNGSAEIVELITEAFVGEGEEAVIGRQAFFKYRIAVQIMNGRIAWAEMPALTYNPEELAKAVTPQTKAVFIANPNNPTGTMMTAGEVDWLMERLPPGPVVVFDEAYYDYRRDEVYPDTLRYVREGRDVIILRTFSKSYGLAALRVGYAIAPAPIALALNAVREAFNVNTLGQVAAAAALDDDRFLADSIRLNEAGKRQYYEGLSRLGLDYVPTEANFVLFKTPIPGRLLFQRLLREGVIIRPVDGYGLPDYVRASIGLPGENELLFAALKKVL